MVYSLDPKDVGTNHPSELFGNYLLCDTVWYPRRLESSSNFNFSRMIHRL